jgi:hypothetical protein
LTRTISALLVATIALTQTLPALAAGQRTAVAKNADMWRSYASHLPIGSTLAIRTTSGERLTAVLFVVDNTAMTVKPKTRVPEPARQISFDDVDELSLRDHRVSIAKYVGIGAAAGAGVFLWFLTAALAGT